MSSYLSHDGFGQSSSKKLLIKFIVTVHVWPTGLYTSNLVLYSMIEIVLKDWTISLSVWITYILEDILQVLERLEASKLLAVVSTSTENMSKLLILVS